MASIHVKDLFDENRCPNGWNSIPFILYFPFGALLAGIRCFISLQMLLFASLFHDLVCVRRFILKMMCNMLGLIVREDFSAARDRTASVYVANQITLLDFLAFYVSSGCVSPKSKRLPIFLNWALGYQEMGLDQGFDSFSTYMRNYLNEDPVLLQPEGSATNGRVGLLRFQHEYLRETRKVQPIALQIWRPPIGSVSPSVLGSIWWVEIFWFFFAPCTVFFLRYLPAVKRNVKEDDESFTRRVEEVIAKRLGVTATKYTVADKTELEKKLRKPPLTRSSPSRPVARPVSIELQRMVAQVVEVLPYVPSDVVLKDLVRTRSVDITISNILEGHIPYVPLQPSSSSTPKHQPAASPAVNSPVCTSSAIGESSSLDTSAPSFAKSAQERTMSFTDRKNRLIENARRRYIEKHGLKLAGLSTVKFG